MPAFFGICPVRSARFTGFLSAEITRKWPPATFCLTLIAHCATVVLYNKEKAFARAFFVKRRIFQSFSKILCGFCVFLRERQLYHMQIPALYPAVLFAPFDAPRFEAGRGPLIFIFVFTGSADQLWLSVFLARAWKTHFGAFPGAPAHCAKKREHIFLYISKAPLPLSLAPCQRLSIAEQNGRGIASANAKGRGSQSKPHPARRDRATRP